MQPLLPCSLYPPCSAADALSGTDARGYRSKAFLHFHEDAAGIYADVKLDLTTFARERVTSPAEQTALLVRIDQVLAHGNRA